MNLRVSINVLRGLFGFFRPLHRQKPHFSPHKSNFETEQRTRPLTKMRNCNLNVAQDEQTDNHMPENAGYYIVFVAISKYDLSAPRQNIARWV